MPNLIDGRQLLVAHNPVGDVLRLVGNAHFDALGQPPKS